LAGEASLYFLRIVVDHLFHLADGYLLGIVLNYCGCLGQQCAGGPFLKHFVHKKGNCSWIRKLNAISIKCCSMLVAVLSVGQQQVLYTQTDRFKLPVVSPRCNFLEAQIWSSLEAQNFV